MWNIIDIVHLVPFQLNLWEKFGSSKMPIIGKNVNSKFKCNIKDSLMNWLL